ncbi:MAG TPA: hypothetical protein VJ242_03405, partial [Patescibacteria group bacterium]|nr:hypothetical protein [Patescibacteria group bacterium]
MFFCDKNGKSVKLMNFHLKDNGRLSFLNAVGGKQGESINKQETTKLLNKTNLALSGIYALPSAPTVSI